MARKVQKANVSRPRFQPDAKALQAPDEIARAMTSMQDGIMEELARVAAQMAQPSAAFGSVPVGFMVWAFSHLKNFPAVPQNFQKCDGSVVNDKRSPLYGDTLPNLIGNAWFVRAGATAGVTQTADAVVPGHAHSMQAHTHDLGGHTHAAGTLKGARGAAAAGAVSEVLNASTTQTATLSTNDLAIGGSTAAAVGSTLGPSVANTAADGGSGTETRPKNISAVPYIRIW